MISVDSETTGVDLRHSAKPFLVTICTEEGENQFWEWNVNPLTREPEILIQDIVDIAVAVDSADKLILQNAKFDVTALSTIAKEFSTKWQWGKTYDTLIAGHLLASSQPHDLTTMALVYLSVNIQPYEDEMKQACIEARRMVRTKDFIAEYGEWMIAKEGLPGMPSAKGGKGRESRGAESEKPWKFDTWLPRAIAKVLDYPKSHPWWAVTSKYANVDSAITLPLWKVQEQLLHKRGLWKIFLERMKVVPVTHSMESRGVTMLGKEMDSLQGEYAGDVKRMGDLCVGIAKGLNYELDLPKGASPNNSLRGFCFDVLNLPSIVSKKSKTGAPSLDKNAMEHYLLSLPSNSKALTFVKALQRKRKRDTILSYMESYKKFWLPCPDRGMYLIHPSLNITGTDTLRFSCSNPNTQQISKQETACARCEGEGCETCNYTGEDLHSLRRVFGPAPRREWYSCDAKNIELRLPAYLSKEQELINLFEHPDDPPYYGSTHLLNFHTVYPEIWEKELQEVGIEKVGPKCKKKYAPTYYQWTKNGGFAVQYGAIDREGGTADAAFHKVGAHAQLKARFSRLEKLNQECIAYANKWGYVETIPDRSVDPERGYPLMCARTDYGRILPTVPLNYKIQGSAMWWTMKAMIRCQSQLDEWREHGGFDGFMTLQVHDEIVFDFPKSRISPLDEQAKRSKFRLCSNLWRIKVLQKLMEQGGDDFGIPTPVNVEYHEHNWSLGKSL